MAVQDNEAGMVQKRKIIVLDDFEHRVLMEALAKQRNEMLSNQMPAGDISDLLLKVIDAPTKKKKVRDERNER